MHFWLVMTEAVAVGAQPAVAVQGAVLVLNGQGSSGAELPMAVLAMDRQLR